MTYSDTSRSEACTHAAAPEAGTATTLTAGLLAAAVAVAAILAATPAPAAEGAGRIATAFEDKGMAPDTSRCYGQQISENLDPAGQKEAARIVSTAQNGEEIEENVKAGGLDMVEAFLAAKTACGT
jgi:hypothetical protein